MFVCDIKCALYFLYFTKGYGASLATELHTEHLPAHYMALFWCDVLLVLQLAIGCMWAVTYLLSMSVVTVFVYNEMATSVEEKCGQLIK